MGLSPLKHQNAVLHLRKPQNYSTPQHFDCVFGKPDSEPPKFSLKCLTNMVTFPMPSLRINVLPFLCVQGMPGDKTETGRKVNYQLSAVCYYFLSLSLPILTSLLFDIYQFEQKMAFSLFFLQHCSSRVAVCGSFKHLRFPWPWAFCPLRSRMQPAYLKTSPQSGNTHPPMPFLRSGNLVPSCVLSRYVAQPPRRQKRVCGQALSGLTYKHRQMLCGNLSRHRKQRTKEIVMNVSWRPPSTEGGLQRRDGRGPQGRGAKEVTLSRGEERPGIF